MAAWVYEQSRGSKRPSAAAPSVRISRHREVQVHLNLSLPTPHPNFKIEELCLDAKELKPSWSPDHIDPTYSWPSKRSLAAVHVYTEDRGQLPYERK